MSARRPRRAVPALVAGVLAATALGALGTAPGQAAEDATTTLQLVTLTGPGTSAGASAADTLVARQDAVLASIGSPATTYRWTTALNGFAADLTIDQVQSTC